MKAQQLAEQLYAAFERRKRDNGEEFTCLKDGHPEWMTDSTAEIAAPSQTR